MCNTKHLDPRIQAATRQLIASSTTLLSAKMGRYPIKLSEFADGAVLTLMTLPKTMALD